MYLFNSLIHIDVNENLILGLMESWKIMNITICEFKLRHNIKFHDGSFLIIMEDIISSLDK
nr:hypothetical protein [Candidatus Profftella armatura (Diaphorina cf. continua)]